jgi:hypothetical protein
MVGTSNKSVPESWPLILWVFLKIAPDHWIRKFLRAMTEEQFMSPAFIRKQAPQLWNAIFVHQQY